MNVKLEFNGSYRGSSIPPPLPLATQLRRSSANFKQNESLLFKILMRETQDHFLKLVRSLSQDASPPHFSMFETSSNASTSPLRPSYNSRINVCILQMDKHSGHEHGSQSRRGSVAAAENDGLHSRRGSVAPPITEIEENLTSCGSCAPKRSDSTIAKSRQAWDMIMGEWTGRCRRGVARVLGTWEE